MKTFKAFVTRKDGSKTTITSDYSNKKDFITDLRKNGYKVNPKKVREQVIFDYITEHTDMSLLDFEMPDSFYYMSICSYKHCVIDFDKKDTEYLVSVKLFDSFDCLHIMNILDRLNIKYELSKDFGMYTFKFGRMDNGKKAVRNVDKFFKEWALS